MRAGTTRSDAGWRYLRPDNKLLQQPQRRQRCPIMVITASLCLCVAALDNCDGRLSSPLSERERDREREIAVSATPL